MKRRFTVITLILAVMLNCCMAVFAYEPNALKYNNAVSRLAAFGIIRSTADPEAYVSRGEFTSMAIKTFGYEANAGVGNSAFADTENSQYNSDIVTAAAIDIVRGDGEGSFLPNEHVSYTQALRVMLAGMGYEQAADISGGFPSGYVKIAQDLGITKNVTPGSDRIKMGDLIMLIDNCLEAPLMKNAYSIGSYKPDESRTILSDYLRVEKRKVTVDGYNANERKITVSEGTVSKTYRAGQYVVLNELSYQTVYIYVGVDDDVVYYVERLRDYQTFYDFISEVNNSAANSFYPVSSIKRVKLTNDGKSYLLDDKALIRYNGEIVTNTAIKPINCFAKVVMSGKKITVLDIYDMEEGGIIYRADNDMIKYIWQDTNDNKISGISKYGEVVIIIDGVLHYEMTDLKPDMLFDYWKDTSGDKEKFIIVASSRTAEGMIARSNGEEIVMDGVSYEYNGKFGPYVYDHSTESYRDGKPIGDAVGHRSKIFIDDNMKVRYVMPDAQEYNDYTFYGVVVKAFDDDGENRMIRLYKLSGSNGVKEYKVAKKLLSDSIDFDYAKSVASDLNGRGVFRFELNNNFEIKKISHIDYFNTVMKVTDQFTDYGSAYINGIYFANSLIFAIYQDKDGFQVKMMNYETNMKNFSADQLDPVIMTCDFDKRNNPFPNLVMLTNITDNFGYKNSGGGFIKSMSLVAGDDANEYEIVIQSSGTENKFRLPIADVTSNRLKPGMWISYSYGFLGDHPIHISNTYDWSKPMLEWQTDPYTPVAQRGTYRADKILFRNNYAIQFEIGGEPTEVYMFYDYMKVWKVKTGKKTIVECDTSANSIENVPRGVPCIFTVSADQTNMRYSITNIYYESDE